MNGECIDKVALKPSDSRRSVAGLHTFASIVENLAYADHQTILQHGFQIITVNTCVFE